MYSEGGGTLVAEGVLSGGVRDLGSPSGSDAHIGQVNSHLPWRSGPGLRDDSQGVLLLR